MTAPVRLVSEANAREHWASRHRRLGGHRRVFGLLLRLPLRALRALHGEGARWRVTITRGGERRLDSDNLAGSAKGVRDGVADALGIDDGDDRIAWVYAQEKAPRGAWWCEVVVEVEQ